eukprot:3735828-Amphidinium_carterae.1
MKDVNAGVYASIVVAQSILLLSVRVLKKDHQRGTSSVTGGSAEGSFKGRSGSNDKNGGKGQPRGKSPGESPKNEGMGVKRGQ